MKRPSIFAGMVLGFAGLLYTAYMLESYHYRDCLKVGHSKFYCILDIAR